MPDITLPEVPRLKQGDRLTRPEFERHYEAMTDVKKAELINRIVYMPSPVRYAHHGKPHSLLITWIGVYVAATPRLEMADNATVRLDLDNEVQPDVLLRLLWAAGGTSRVGEDDYQEGPPEFIAEIAASSTAYDLHDKRSVYRRSGVQEYLVWQIYENKIDWFVLDDGAYVPLLPTDDSIYHCRTFPGLHLHAHALRTGNLAQVLDVLRQGTETTDHTALVERLVAASG